MKCCLLVVCYLFACLSRIYGEGVEPQNTHRTQHLGEEVSEFTGVEHNKQVLADYMWILMFGWKLTQSAQITVFSCFSIKRSMGVFAFHCMTKQVLTEIETMAPWFVMFINDEQLLYPVLW